MRNTLEQDDRDDAVARMLREQAGQARLQPSAALRTRTLAEVRSPTAPLRMPPARSSIGSWSLAAAAMIALTVLAVWSLRPPSAPVERSRMNAQTFRDLTAPMRQPVVRLATFTQPLEREAAALRSDIKRLTDRVRSAIPSSRKPVNDELNPSL